MHLPLVSAPPVSASAILAEGHLTQAFDHAVIGASLTHVRRRHLALRQLTLTEIAEACDMSVETSVDGMGQLLVVGQVGERELAEVVVHHGAGHVRVATDDPAVADELLDRLCVALAAEECPEDPRVPIWFWTLSEHGPEPMRRRLHAPRWADIAPNYLAPVRDALAQIMATPPDAARGIALWQGAPGTGKTTALRALAQEWREQVDLHVIVDPEVFLGDRANYLVQVLFGRDVDEFWDGEGDGPAGAHMQSVGGHPGMIHPTPSMSPARGSARASRAKLIVLEDAGELISADARVSSGQALSRLLNLTDGMLGQGSNVSVLVTTNEPIDRLHSAISRPGRSWAHIEFGILPADEANEWLRDAGSVERVREPTTLAELYGLLRGDQVVRLDMLES